MTVTNRARLILPAALTCELESAVAEPHDPWVRSAVVYSIIEEIYQSVAWALGGDDGQPELVSLAQVLAAARAHDSRAAVSRLGGVA
jgi:hypothetical protein